MLDARADASQGPWWALHRTVPASARHRIVWPDLCRRLQATLLTSNQVPLNSCYLAVASSGTTASALCAWLNATPVRGLALSGADRARGGFARFNARVVGALPFPKSAHADRRLSQITNEAAAGREIQHELDRLASDHLGLSARDRRALRALA